MRGVGSSTNVSRTGFYTTFVGYLSITKELEGPNITEIFELIKTELFDDKDEKVNIQYQFKTTYSMRISKFPG